MRWFVFIRLFCRPFFTSIWSHWPYQVIVIKFHILLSCRKQHAPPSDKRRRRKKEFNLTEVHRLELIPLTVGQNITSQQHWDWHVKKPVVWNKHKLSWHRGQANDVIVTPAISCLVAHAWMIQYIFAPRYWSSRADAVTVRERTTTARLKTYRDCLHSQQHC